jgi:large subunit ribosomal protein L29
MVKASELIGLDDDQLDSLLVETRQALFNQRFQKATGQLDNIASMAATRRDVARILTEMRAREIQAAEALWAEEEGS